MRISKPHRSNCRLQKEKIWSLSELLKITERLFSENNISNPRLNAELILSSVLNTSRINLYLDFEKPLTEYELDTFREKVKRRLNKEPLQYIIGKTEFFGFSFIVNNSVLIPRPETELLVEKTIELIKSEKLISPKILEIGTGSGCISIALAKSVECSIDAIDISETALETARQNSRINNTEACITFENKNIFNSFSNFGVYDVIISNPPYISKDEMITLPEEIKNYEPESALTDYNDGLNYYKKIIELFKKTNKKISVLLEIGDGKSEKVKNLLSHENIKNFQIYRDLNEIERVLLINK